MKLHLYILKHICLVALVVTSLLLGTIWLTQSVRFVELALGQPDQHVWWLILKLTLLLIPDLFVIICPFSFFLAVVYTYNRFSYDREITIMRSIGMSNLQLASPVLTIGAALVLLLTYLNIWILPATTTHLKDMESSMRGVSSLAFVKINEFNNFPGLLLYVKSQDSSRSFQGILAYVQEPNGQSYTLIAQRGELLRGSRNKLSLLLENGQKQDLNPSTKSPQTLAFEKTYLHIDQTSEVVKDRSRKSAEYSLEELFFKKHEDLPLHDQRRLHVEGFARLLTPFSPLSYMLLGACALLVSSYRRRGLVWPVIFSGLFLIIVHAIYMMFINIAVQTLWGLVGALLIVFGGMGSALLILWLKKMPFLFRFQLKRGTT